MRTAEGLVDFHCHLDLFPDFPGEVKAADDAGVFTLAVTTTPRAWPKNHELAQRTKHVRAALGLHPQLVADHEHELELWDRLLPGARYIGEVGLDNGPRYFKSMEGQKRVFKHVLRRCAEIGNKVVTVHSVRAVKAVLDHIEEHLPASRGKVVLHWFTGTKAEARRAVELGCYFSINAAMLTERHASLVAELPIDRLLTETDGPFTRCGERPARPADVHVAVDALAHLRGLAAPELASAVRSNLRTLIA
jgi:TatD DNase family protein